jgi:hypothetical protein
MDKEKEIQENARRNRYCNVDLGGQKMNRKQKIFVVKLKAEIPMTQEEVEQRFKLYYMGKNKEIEVIEIV